MKRICLIGLVTALAATTATAANIPAPAYPSAPAPAVAPDADFAEIVRRLREPVENGRLAEALAVAVTLPNAPDFAGLPEARRHWSFHLIGLLAAEADDHEQAVAAFRQATALSVATPEDWLQLFMAQAALQRRSEAAASLTRAIVLDAAVLERLNDDYVRALAVDAAIDDDVLAPLRGALRASGWDPEHGSWLWLRHVGDLIAQDRWDEARLVAARVTRAETVLQMLSQRRYDPLWSADFAPPDLDVLYAAELAEIRADALGPDASIMHQDDYAQALYDRGHVDEAMAVIDRTMAGDEPEPGSDDWRGWTWMLDTQARILLSLGRIEDGLAVQRRAAERAEQGGRNVSQTINLSWRLHRSGLDQEALDAVRDFEGDDVSPYGQALVARTRACAALAQGDVTTADAALTYLRANWRDAPGGLAGALACRDDVEGAAALMVERLSDPKLAGDALLQLQDYTVPPSPGTLVDARLDAHMALVAAHPDVIAARDRVGRVLSVPVVRPGRW